LTDRYQFLKLGNVPKQDRSSAGVCDAARRAEPGLLLKQDRSPDQDVDYVRAKDAAPPAIENFSRKLILILTINV
jgi:hypothetical protein